MTPLILSADDFGLDAGIDAAVLDLALRGRLTATSCLTLSPRWHDAARSLTPDVRHRIDVGLHLDFTEFEAAMSWSTLVMASCARRLRAADVARPSAGADGALGKGCAPNCGGLTPPWQRWIGLSENETAPLRVAPTMAASLFSLLQDFS